MKRIRDAAVVLVTILVVFGITQCWAYVATPAEPVPEHSPYVAPTTSPSAVYANCTEARAAGVAPLHPTDPGYAPRLDRDNDGVACEP